MKADKDNVLILAKEFVKICEKENIWYTVDNGTMLGAVREKGMIKWDDDFDVMMTPESFEKFKKLYPDRIIDTDNKNYPLLIPKFMFNKNDFLSSAVFVDIFILVPSTKKQVKNFCKFSNKLRFAMQAVHTTWIPYSKTSKIFQLVTKPFKKLPKRMTYNDSIKMLHSKNPTLHFTIDNPYYNPKINLKHRFIYERQKIEFEDFHVYIPYDWHKILISKYGHDYMVPKKEFRSIEHINAVSVVRVKRK